MEKRRVLSIAVSSEDRIGNNQQDTAADRVENRIGDPENPSQSQMLLHTAGDASTDDDIAALTADGLIGNQCVAAEIAIHALSLECNKLLQLDQSSKIRDFVVEGSQGNNK